MENHTEDMPGANNIESGSPSIGVGFEIVKSESSWLEELNQRIIKDIAGQTVNFSTRDSMKRGNARIEITDLLANLNMTNQVFKSFDGKVVGVFPNVNVEVPTGLSKMEKIRAIGSANGLVRDAAEIVFLDQVIQMSGKNGGGINWRGSGYENAREARSRLHLLEDRMEKSSISLANPTGAKEVSPATAGKRSRLPVMFPKIRTEISQTIDSVVEYGVEAVKTVKDFVDAIPTPVKVLGVSTLALAGCTPSNGVAAAVPTEAPSETISEPTPIGDVETPEQTPSDTESVLVPDQALQVPEATEAAPTQEAPTQESGEVVDNPDEGVYFTAPNLEELRVPDGAGGRIDDVYLDYRDNVLIPGLREQGFDVASEDMMFYSWGEGDDFRWGFVPVNEDGNMIWAHVNGQRAIYPVYLENAGGGFDLKTDGVDYVVIEDSVDAVVRPGGSNGLLPIPVKSPVEIDRVSYFGMFHNVYSGEWEVSPGLEGKYEIVDGQLVEIVVEPTLGEFGFLAMHQEQSDWFQSNQELLRLPPQRYPLLLDGEQIPYGANSPFAGLRGDNFMTMGGVISRMLFPPIGETTHPLNAGGFGVMVPETGQDLGFGGELLNLAIRESAGDSGVMSININEGTWITNEDGSIGYEGEYTTVRVSFNNFTAFMKEHIQNGNLEGSDILFTVKFVHGSEISDLNFGELLSSLTDGSAGDVRLFPSPLSKDNLPVFNITLPGAVFEAHPDMLADLQALSDD